MATIVVIGATGFIGSAIARALIDDGHQLRLVGRDLATGRRLFPHADWRWIDLNRVASADDWGALLDGAAIVINASGLLQSGGGDDVARIQHRAVVALADAAARSGCERIIQISAAGAAGNASDFMATKLEADAALLAGPVPALILRPGLVIGRNAYGGTQLIRMAAAVPIGFVPRDARPIRSIAMDDVVDAVRHGLTRDLPGHPVDLVGTEALPLATIIAEHRRWLGYADWRLRFTLPAWLLAGVSASADALGLLGWRSPLRRNAMTALQNGVDGDAAATAAWLGRPPQTLRQTLTTHPAGMQDRVMATAMLLMPVALGALFLMWFLSGVATLIDLPRAATHLQAAGLGASASRWLGAGGALLDGLLALLLLPRRTVRWALIGIMIVATAYLLIGAMAAPALWLDPLAPYAKVLPGIILAAMLLPMVAKR